MVGVLVQCEVHLRAVQSERRYQLSCPIASGDEHRIEEYLAESFMALERIDHCRDVVCRSRLLDGHITGHRVGQHLTVPDQFRHTHKIQKADEIQMKPESLFANPGEQAVQQSDAGCERAAILRRTLHTREETKIAVKR